MRRLVNSHEAAEILGLSARSLKRLVKKGMLHPIHTDKLKPYSFLEHEVVALAEARKDKRMGFREVQAMSKQAYATARSTEKVLQQVIRFLGIDIPRLSLNPEDVRALHLRAEDAQVMDFYPTATEVLGWARIFQAIDDNYLDMVKQVSRVDEPWKAYLDLATLLDTRAPEHVLSADAELKVAVGCVSAARRNLRNVTYFYIRQQYGKRVAARAIPHITADVDEEVIALAFPS